MEQLRVAVVGAGRLGIALAAAFRMAGLPVTGPARRGELPSGDVVILCVPDSEIARAAAAVAGRARFVGHTSGIVPLKAAAAAAGAELFGLHPLQTITGDTPPTAFAGAGCAVAGSTPEALALARSLAEAVGMRPFEITDEQRPAYHAAASMASNLLVTLEYAAERVAAGTGLGGLEEIRPLLAPLVRQTVDNWADLGPERALTGPMTRGDETTVATQRAAVSAVAPEVLPAFDALVQLTRTMIDNAVEGSRRHHPDDLPQPLEAR